MANLPMSTTDEPMAVIDTVSDAVNVITDLMSGVSVPAPIRRSAFKAFSQLCTAAIEIPIAHLEGLATERRAETQGRVKIIESTAEQIARQINVDPEYSRVAIRKFGAKIVREQVNLDQISEVAAAQLRLDATHVKQPSADETTFPEISDDWLNAFEREACQKSTQDMQLLFGRILSGEICKPSSFSIKTIKLMSQLDSRTANIFKRLCSLAACLEIGPTVVDARVISLGGNAGSNCLKEYGLSFDQLNILNEYGLIIPDYNSYIDYVACVAEEGQIVGVFRFEKSEWGLVPAPDRPKDEQVRIHGVALTRAGRELMSIVDIDASESYRQALVAYLDTMKLRLVPVNTPVEPT